MKSVLVADDDVRHVFSGFDLELRVVQIELAYAEVDDPLHDITKAFRALQSKQGRNLASGREREREDVCMYTS